MYKRLISVVITVSVIASSLPRVSATMREQTINNSISGYISLSEGVHIAGINKTPSIHIDSNDYEGVLLAANNLAEDIQSVVGKNPTVSNNDITVPFDGGKGIIIDGDSMNVSLDSPVSKNAACYVAAYNKRGVLTALIKNTDNPSDDNTVTSSFSFDTSLSRPAGGKLKSFIWDETMETKSDTLGLSPSKSAVLDGIDIVIGTLGISETIDALALTGKLDISAIDGEWESFTIQNVNNTIVIAGSDKRGTIYGIYDFCEKIGISPWSWWADADSVQAENLYVNLPEGGYTEGTPSVKYRGIFINDEYNLNQWSTALGNGNAMTHETYEKIFELLLRLKANCLLPAMHPYSPSFHMDKENTRMADKYGIVIGSSHTEPLLRNNAEELDSFQDKWEEENPGKALFKNTINISGKKVAYYWTDHDNNGNTVYNKEFLEDYWREGVRRSNQYENIYTVGMSGVHDGGFETNMDISAALTEIIAVQRKILKEEICDKTGQKIEDIPQIFIPSKDILYYYNKNLIDIPDDVTIICNDDGYGYMRQNTNDTERSRTGGIGAYYHISYYGRPASYLWLSCTQPALIREEMSRAYNMGADKIWIVNAGDIKPAENDVEYFLKLAYDIDKTNEKDIGNIFSDNAKRDFNMNDADARKYAEIMTEYYELANAKRPELVRSNEFSLTSYGDEAQRYMDRCKKLAVQAEALSSGLSDEKKDCFFELALYPIRSFANIITDYIQTDRANLYNLQGRGAAPYQFADEASKAAADIDTDTTAYNSLRGGKWDKIMNLRPYALQGSDAHITTVLHADKPSELDYTSLAVSVDSQTSLNENPVLNLSVYDTYNKFIDIINQGYGSFDYTLSCAPAASDTNTESWFNFSKTSGHVNGNDRVYISLNKNADIPYGNTKVYIQAAQKLGEHIVDTKYIQVNISNPDISPNPKTYVAANGTVSIEAEHYSRSVSTDNHEWKPEKDFGRSGDSMKVYPDLSENITSPDISHSAYLEYDVYFEEGGTYTWDIYRMPTLNERDSMKFAVGIDDSAPKIITGNNKYIESTNITNKWSQGVLNNSEKLSVNISVPSSGFHKVRVYSMTSGIVIDKMVLTYGTNVPKSYFGAPESYNTTYNNTIEAVPKYTDISSAENINKLYEPDVVIGNIISNKTAQTLRIPIIPLTDTYTNAVVAVTGYDKDGNMTSCDFQKADLSGMSEMEFHSPLSDTDTSGYTITVFDNFTNLHPIAPYKKFGTIPVKTTGESINIQSDLSLYSNKKSIILIADCEINENITADHIKYLYGENITTDSYKNIPFADKVHGTYHIRIGIDKENAVNELLDTTQK